MRRKMLTFDFMNENVLNNQMNGTVLGKKPQTEILKLSWKIYVNSWKLSIHSYLL